ncbi:MAG: hypothetical protein ACKPKO_28895 [Candidatus Fonsibacter sp.]
MGGMVLVSTWEHIQRLIACRLQGDILNTPLVTVARTDAVAATLTDSDVDGILDTSNGVRIVSSFSCCCLMRSLITRQLVDF